MPELKELLRKMSDLEDDTSMDEHGKIRSEYFGPFFKQASLEYPQDVASEAMEAVRGGRYDEAYDILGLE